MRVPPDRAKVAAAAAPQLVTTKPANLTDAQLREALAKLGNHITQLEKYANGLAVQMQQVHEENKELKRKYKDLETSVKESLKGCALLPTAPAWKYLDETPEEEAEVRALTVFELQCIVDGIRKLDKDDPRLKELALITCTEPDSDGFLNFRVREWSDYVQWCAYYCVRFHNVKKRAVQHTRHTLLEEQMSKHDDLSVKVEAVEAVEAAPHQRATQRAACVSRAKDESTERCIQIAGSGNLTAQDVREGHARKKREQSRTKDHKARLKTAGRPVAEAVFAGPNTKASSSGDDWLSDDNDNPAGPSTGPSGTTAGDEYSNSGF
tara:strand:- start:2 stop:967 length:966 start_codon:yes stop_codon:yes gene_type:complete